MRIRRFVLIALLLLVMLPFTAFAQDDLVWSFDAKNFIDAPDLGFRFYYPLGWTFDLSSGFAFAETEADLAAELDDDDSTIAEGSTISVSGIPLEALPDLGEDPTLDAIVDFGVEAAGVTETRRVETTVLARRAIAIFAVNEQEQPGVAVFWLQGDYVVRATVGTPDAATLEALLPAWSLVLLSIEPLDALPLSEEPLLGSNFSVSYPADWTVDPNQPTAAYESADDIGAEFADVTGSIFTLVDAALTDMGMAEDTTLEEVAEEIKASFNLDENATTEAFVLLGQPALTVWGEPSADSPGADHGVIFTVALVEGRAVAMALVTPSPEAAEAFLPTWTAMIRSAVVTEASE